MYLLLIVLILCLLSPDRIAVFFALQYIWQFSEHCCLR